MNINSAFPSKYLKADDAEQDLILTIRGVKVETVGQGPKAEQKPVVYFVEVEKGIVLNKTNAKMIAKIAKSDDTDHWKGVIIRLISTEVEFQGDLVMSLRVREVKRKPTQDDDGRAEAPTADDIPF
jgi:hypothetical protein